MGHTGLEGDRTRAADSKGSKGYSISYDITQKLLKSLELSGTPTAAQICHQVLSNCMVHHLFCIYIFY